MAGPRTVENFLEPSGQLGHLIERARSLAALERALLAEFPPELASNCRVLNVSQGTLLIATESAGWATRLRYEVPRLLTWLRQSPYSRVDAVRVVVRPISEPLPAAERPANRPSPTAAENIRAAADSIEDDALRTALARLARHAQSGNR